MNTSKKPAPLQPASWIAISIAISLSIGAAMHNIGVGLAIGIALGIALGVTNRKKDDGNNEGSGA